MYNAMSYLRTTIILSKSTHTAVKWCQNWHEGRLQHRTFFMLPMFCQSKLAPHSEN